MSATLKDLLRIPATDVKTRGWKGVMRALAASGPVVVTNHAEPEAVIVSARDYARLLAVVEATASKTEAGLESLRRSFDERLAILNKPDAGERLRALGKRPAALRGKVKAGSGY